jgi:phosphonate degradation associated HDIG domain protein
MIHLSSLADIEQVYAERGGQHYGEDVTQIEHAVQCAALAEADNASASLIAAALLHDIGHLFARDDEVASFTHDGRHEVAGARLLAGLFGEAVCQPIALHVAAKRYLCFREPLYHEALSLASRQSLALQGGPFDAAEAAAFEHHAYWRDAVLLRRFDDKGKQDELSARRFVEFLPALHAAAR